MKLSRLAVFTAAEAMLSSIPRPSRPPRHLVLLLAVLGLPWVAGPAPAEPVDCAVLDIDALGAERLELVTARLPLTVELDDRLFACAEDLATLQAAASAVDRRIGTTWRDVEPADLFLVRRAHPHVGMPRAGVEQLTGAAGHELVRATDAASRASLRAGHWQAPPSEHACRPSLVRPLLTQTPSVAQTSSDAQTSSLQQGAIHRVAVRQTANRPRRRGTSFPPAVIARVDAVDSQSWLDDIDTLASWNRYSFGRSIDLARDWLLARFESLGLEASTETFNVGSSDTRVENVFGRRAGSLRPDDLVIVGGHYDSTSQSPSSAAPGAEDNASGCAAVLELARVLAPVEVEATIVFVCYAGEEQGLYGSRDHAAKLVASGDAAHVVLMLNMDMIGYSADADLDLLLETEDEWTALPPIFEDAAARFTDLRTVVSFFAFGSDHVPFLDRGMPALLTIENDWDIYPDYHRTTDLPDRIVESMGLGVLRTNAAVLALTAGVVDQSLLFADGFESGDLTAWAPPEPSTRPKTPSDEPPVERDEPRG